jgi:hypothetical protein
LVMSSIIDELANLEEFEGVVTSAGVDSEVVGSAAVELVVDSIVGSGAGWAVEFVDSGIVELAKSVNMGFAVVGCVVVELVMSKIMDELAKLGELEGVVTSAGVDSEVVGSAAVELVADSMVGSGAGWVVEFVDPGIVELAKSVNMGFAVADVAIIVGSEVLKLLVKFKGRAVKPSI